MWLKQPSSLLLEGETSHLSKLRPRSFVSRSMVSIRVSPEAEINGGAHSGCTAWHDARASYLSRMERELRDQHTMAVSKASEVVDQALKFLQFAEWQTRLPLDDVELTIVRCRNLLRRVATSLHDKIQAAMMRPRPQMVKSDPRCLNISSSARPSLSGRLSSAIPDPGHDGDGEEAGDGVDTSILHSRAEQIKDMVAILTEIKAMAATVDTAMAATLDKAKCADHAEYDTFFVRMADAQAVLELLTYLNILEDLLVAVWNGDKNAFLPLLAMKRISMSMTYSADNPLSAIRSLFVPSVDSYDMMVGLARKLKSVILGMDTPVVQQGTIGTTMYFIADGSVSVTLCPNSTHGAQLVVCDELMPGQFFGEIALLFNTQRKATVATTSSHAHVYELSRDAYEELINAHPPIRGRIEDVSRPRVSRMDIFEKENAKEVDAVCAESCLRATKDVLAAEHCRLLSGGKMKRLPSKDDDAPMPYLAPDSDIRWNLLSSDKRPPAEWGSAYAKCSWGTPCVVPMSEPVLQELSEVLRTAFSQIVEDRTCPSRQSSSQLANKANKANKAERVLVEMDEIMECIGSRMSRLTLSEGDFVARKGDKGGCLYVIESGLVERFVPGSDETHLHEPNLVLGMIVTFLVGIWPHDLRVKSRHCTLLALDTDDILSILGKHPMMIDVFQGACAGYFTKYFKSMNRIPQDMVQFVAGPATARPDAAIGNGPLDCLRLTEEGIKSPSAF